jgi:hypothetical protein
MVCYMWAYPKGVLLSTPKEKILETIKSNGNGTYFIFDRVPTVGDMEKIYERYAIQEMKMRVSAAVINGICSGL